MNNDRENLKHCFAKLNVYEVGLHVNKVEIHVN